MRFFYTLAVQCYRLGIFIASRWNGKAKKWIDGRNNILDTLEKSADDRQPILFHCASLGEFEQGKPLMVRLKEENPTIKIWVTFFSPSGYEVRKNDPLSDVVTYLPLDTPYYARKFVEIVNPSHVFFIKYEYWYNLMEVLAENKIPFYYVSATFRPDQIFFRKTGGWFAKQLRKATYFFVQNEDSKRLLHQIGIDNVSVTGDTRFDRVHAIASQQIELDFVEEFKSDAKLIVAGSTWPPDEDVLARLLVVLRACSLKYKIMIAPHLVDENHIENILRKFEDFNVIRYTDIEEKSLKDAEVFIVDQIGLLSRIFQYSDISYVGGGFETGLHNILEPAVYGMPLFFGPQYDKFNEATALVELGAAFPVTKQEELFEKIVDFEQNSDSYRQVCEIAKEYVRQNLGAVNRIIDKIEK